MDFKLFDSYAFVEEVWCPPEDEDLFYYEACLAVENILNVTIALYKVIDLCHKCESQFWTNILPESTEKLLVQVASKTSFHYKDTSSGLSSCVVSYQFVQHGIYSYTADFSCDEVNIVTPPDNPYTCFFVFATALIVVWVIYMLLVFLHARKKAIVAYARRNLRLAEKPTQHWNFQLESNEVEEGGESNSEVELKTVYDETTGEEKVIEFVSRGINTEGHADETESGPLPAGERLPGVVEFDALLALRGFTVCVWVFLYVEGNSFSAFKQSPWNGFRIADVPAGWLYWVLAASVYVRLRHGLASGQTRRRLLFRSVLLRSALYIIGGFIYNNINNTSPRATYTRSLSTVRIPGIFQRAGLALIVPAAVEVAFARRRMRDGRFFGDVVDGLPQWSAGVALAAVHSCVTYLMPVAGCPTGYTGPGGLAGHRLCTGGAAGRIDRTVFPDEHLLSGEEFEGFRPLFRVKAPFDPHGLLGTLTTAFLMTSAMHAARIFAHFRGRASRCARLLAWAAAQLLFGGILCEFSEHDGLVPSNRHLMSVSYVLLASGSAYLALCVLYVLVSVKGKWSGFPLVDAGVNVLVVVVGNELLQRTFPFQWMVTTQRTCTEFLFMAIWSVFVWCVICNKLVKNRIIFPV